MPEFKRGDKSVAVSTSLVIRMADRLHKLGNQTRRDAYVERARKRVQYGYLGKNDIATLLAKGITQVEMVTKPAKKANYKTAMKMVTVTSGPAVGKVDPEKE